MTAKSLMTLLKVIEIEDYFLDTRTWFLYLLSHLFFLLQDSQAETNPTKKQFDVFSTLAGFCLFPSCHPCWAPTTTMNASVGQAALTNAINIQNKNFSVSIYYFEAKTSQTVSNSS